MTREDAAKSMFTMEDVNEIIKLPIAQAKTRAAEIVDDSSANMMNKFKAMEAIRRARSSTEIATSMSNFLLAHPSNGLKVI